jgi:hypothetical protein
MSAGAVQQAHELLERLEREGVVARALGGIAVALRCPSASRPPLARDYHDLDLATDHDHGHRLAEALAAAGYAPAERFNALHGHSRMMFSGPNDLHVDVLVDKFVMCHELSFRGRLDVHHETIGLGDLLLTKLQIAQINHKDVVDVATILVDHALTQDESGVNVRFIVELLSNDWGWWRTVTANLEIASELLSSLGLAREQADVVDARLHELQSRIATGKRSLRWKARARIGERVAWRFDPEEVAT